MVKKAISKQIIKEDVEKYIENNLTAISELTIEVKDERLFNAINNMVDFTLYKLFIVPIFRKKIVTILIEGPTGSGKSMLSLALAERLENLFSRIMNVKNKFSVKNQVVIVPTDYGDKLDLWATSPYITFVIDELRFLVPKHKWQSLLNQSIAETNAVIRAVKVDNCKYGGIIIYNTQDISDITKDVRKTINYDIIINRSGKLVKAYLRSFWSDKKNIEKPILKHKRSRFIHNSMHFVLDYMVPTLPSTAIRKEYEKISVEEKFRILKRKRTTIMNEMKKELGSKTTLEAEISNDEMFNILKDMAIWRKNKVTFSSEKKKIIQKLFMLNGRQFRTDFIPLFVKEATKRGLI